MSYSLNSLKEVKQGGFMGVIKEDTRSLDYGTSHAYAEFSPNI